MSALVLDEESHGDALFTIVQQASSARHNTAIGSFVRRLISQYGTRGSATSKAPTDAGLFSLQLGRAERTTLFGSQEFIVDHQLAADTGRLAS